MKIEKLNVFHVDAGWRPWSFLKISTKCGIVGWSEFSDSHGSPRGIEGVITDLTPLIIDKDPRNIQLISCLLYARTRQSPGSVVQKAISAIENALWDIKAKDLGIPVYEFFGGAVRHTIPLYWSHCGTSRVRAAKLIEKNPIKNKKDLLSFCDEFLDSGFNALKTNMVILSEEPYVYMPGFSKSKGGPELNLTREIARGVEDWIATFRMGLGSDIDIALDLNFNFKTVGFIEMSSRLEEYQLSWLEIDSYDPVALSDVKRSIKTPIVSCENLYGAGAYKPFFDNLSMDIASIDIIWNGISQSIRIAQIADLYEMNVCTHNFNGNLSTMISANFCAAVPNLRIAEVDVDDVPWRDELFTHAPQIRNGYMSIPTEPGWGTNVNEQSLAKYKWLP